ncbi:hypothetical protein BP5796_09734 [Coleophoma crateriformis]|uniref:Uncharacterized protein n=1 Tax=Coleophoma crateriformis TaxID=565419 RepID=A0A3D8QZ03_9HELO|nr:hypothetical protein BP5796_09734 [Coleophoma crateriformis]
MSSNVSGLGFDVDAGGPNTDSYSEICAGHVSLVAKACDRHFASALTVSCSGCESATLWIVMDLMLGRIEGQPALARKNHHRVRPLDELRHGDGGAITNPAHQKPGAWLAAEVESIGRTEGNLVQGGVSRKRPSRQELDVTITAQAEDRKQREGRRDGPNPPD